MLLVGLALLLAGRLAGVGCLSALGIAWSAVGAAVLVATVRRVDRRPGPARRLRVVP